MDAKVAQVEDMVWYIQHLDLSVTEQKQAVYEKYFRTFGLQEIKLHREVSRAFLPFSDLILELKDVFYSPNLLYKDQDNNTIEFKCNEIFQKLENNFILIVGEAGSGKTSLIQRIVDETLERSEPEVFPGIRKFQIVLHIECGDDRISSCIQLVKQKFPETLKQMDDIEFAVEVLSQMNVLIAVDDLDELNKSSGELLCDLIDKFGVHGNATFVLTSRSGALSKWTQVVKVKELHYDSLTMKLLTTRTEQIQFLKVYHDKLPNILHPELINGFTSLILQGCSQINFSYPIFLTMFCYLFKKEEDPQSWATEHQLAKKFLKACEDYLITRLEKTDKNTQNSHSAVVKFMETLGGLSFSLLQKDSLVLNEPTCKEIFTQSIQDFDCVGHQTVLSCLTMEGVGGHKLLHRSLLEVMASKVLVARWTEANGVSLVELISNSIINPPTEANSIINPPTNKIQSGDDQVEGHSGRTTVNITAFLPVLRVSLVQVLLEGPQATVATFLETLCRDLRPFRHGFQYWAQLAADHPTSVLVVRAAAQEVLATGIHEEQTRGVGEQRGWMARVRARWRRRCRSAGTWRVTSARHVVAAARMLQHRQPLLLQVTLPAAVMIPPTLATTPTTLAMTPSTLATTPSTLATTPSTLATTPSTLATTPSTLATTPSTLATTPSTLATTPSTLATTGSAPLRVSVSDRQELLQAVQERFTNRLQWLDDHSFTTFDPDDETLLQLCSSRCRLVSYQGCLSTEAAQSALAARTSTQGAEPGGLVWLSVALTHPHSHQLALLRGIHHGLSVRTKVPRGGPITRRPRPLPQGSLRRPPRLVVVLEPDQGAAREVAALVISLTPLRKGYYVLYLVSWPGTDEALDQLIILLTAAGVRTLDSMGSPRWSCDTQSWDGCMACGASTHTRGRCVELFIPMSSEEWDKYWNSR